MGILLKTILESQQPRERVGFRNRFFTIDHLTALNLPIEKCQEYNKKLYLAFIDYRKAFDSVKHESVYKAMQNQGVPKTYRRVIKEIYAGLKSKTITEIARHEFEIK